MANITEDSRLSLKLVISLVGLAFWVGGLSAVVIRQGDDMEVLKRDRDEDRRVIYAKLDELNRIGAKLDLLLLLEPRDQQKARSRP